MQYHIWPLLCTFAIISGQMPSPLPPAEHSSYSYMAFGIFEDCLHSFSGVKVYKYLSAEVVWPGWGFPVHTAAGLAPGSL